LDSEVCIAKFLTAFHPDHDALGPCPSWSEKETRETIGYAPQIFTEFLQTAACSSFENGLLRFFLPNTSPSLETWNRSSGWKSAWPIVKEHLTVFASDWQGNQIGFDRRRVANGEPEISLFEPGTGKILKVSRSFRDLIDTDLLLKREPIFVESIYHQWIKSRRQPQFGECVGYKIPLFLSGTDSLTNMTLSDMDVYLTLSGNLLTQK
jgi:hypothetical protein